MKAILTVSKLTDRFNGYGMPIVEVNSTANIEVINRGYNEFESITEIDESDLLRLRQNPYLQEKWTDTIMLEITTPSAKTNCWYKLQDQYIGQQRRPELSNIQW